MNLTMIDTCGLEAAKEVLEAQQIRQISPAMHKLSSWYKLHYAERCMSTTLIAILLTPTFQQLTQLR